MPDVCPEYQPLLARAADGSIAAADRERLDRHLGNCLACREALAAQDLAHRLLAERAIDRASAGFSTRVMVGIEAGESWLDALDFRRWTWRLVPVTAAAALAAVVWAGPIGAGSAATGTDTEVVELPVSAALMSDQVTGADVVSLLLFSNPDDPLAEALEEVPR